MLTGMRCAYWDERCAYCVLGITICVSVCIKYLGQRPIYT